MTTLGNKIRKLREKRGLTQTELGNLISVGKTTISNYETNYSSPDVETIKKIADYFNVSTDYLLGRGDDPEKDLPSYYIDQDTQEMAQEIFENPDLRILFDASRDLKTDDIKAVTDLLKRFKGEE